MATPIPENTATFTLGDIARATQGSLEGGDAGEGVAGVQTDSRGTVAGKLFVALSGERFDGHRFLADVQRQGAKAALVRRDAVVPGGLPVVRADDTLVALGRLARAHRRRWGKTLVAVAGSAGKTTTRSAIALALEAVYPGAVHSVAGNLNNRIGVPMVLFGLGDAHAAAVVEIGTNVRGEVRELTDIAQPSVGVLTLVDMEHAEGIGTLDDIEAEEGDLLRGLGKAGTAIANADDERATRQLVESAARRKIGYGTRGACDYHIIRRESLGLGGSRVVIERPRGRGRRDTLTLTVPLLGTPGALAIAAAVAVADRVAGRPVAAERLQAVLDAGALGEPGRLRPVELGDRTLVLDDTYNANPASVRAALATAREIADDRAARLVLVLGEMRELGPESRALHEQVGEDIAASGASLLVAIGGDARCFVGRAEQAGIEATFAADSAQAAPLVLARVRPGDVVLVKASRGVRAEEVVTRLVQGKGRAA
jgi:UDP-N-acetylmuramoyl-tripeptide--D-alanyl-D-alanine ligase